MPVSPTQISPTPTSPTRAGPLTTVFSQPADCTANSNWFTSTHDGTALSLLDLHGTRTSCYPQPYSGHSTSSLYFSPGACPESYRYVATNVDETGGGVTSAVCCPFGIYTARNYASFLTKSADQLSLCVHSVTDTSHAQTTTVFSLANPITVAWKQADLSLFTPASAPVEGLRSAGVTISSESSTSTTTTSSSSNSDSHHTGLSTGAAAGIGVGATIGGLLILAGLIWFCMRFRVSKRKSRPTSSSGQTAELAATEAAAQEEKARAPETSGLDAKESRPVEADSKTRNELDGSAPAAELDGGFEGHGAGRSAR